MTPEQWAAFTKELVRQLAESGHHFGECAQCGFRFKAEIPVEDCAMCGESGAIKADRAQADEFYAMMIEHAKAWALKA